MYRTTPFVSYALGWGAPLEPGGAPTGPTQEGLIIPTSFLDPTVQNIAINDPTNKAAIEAAAARAPGLTVATPDQVAQFQTAHDAEVQAYKDATEFSLGDALVKAGEFALEGVGGALAVAATAGAALPVLGALPVVGEIGLGTLGGGMVLTADALKGKLSIGDFGNFALPTLKENLPDFGDISIGGFSAPDISGALDGVGKFTDTWGTISGGVDALNFPPVAVSDSDIDALRAALAGGSATTTTAKGPAATPAAGTSAAASSATTAKPFNPMLLAGYFLLGR